MLTTEQVRHFRDFGYTVRHHMFDDREIKAMLSELHRFQKQGLGRNVSTDPEAKVNYQIIPLNDKSDLFRALPFAPKVIESVAQLIGHPFARHLDQIFLKPPGIGMGTDWHQDNAYFKLDDPTKGTAMWIALHDANLLNGTLHVIPNSHRMEFDHARDPESDHHIHIELVEGTEVPVEIEAGGAVFFNYGTAHATKRNESQHARAGLAYHFLNTDCPLRQQSPFSLVKITGDEASGGREEYGEMIAGTWEREVAKLAAKGTAEA